VQWRELASSFTFDELDRDKSGYVSRREIAVAYAKKHGTALSPMLLDSMMKTLDLDGNDTIGKRERESCRVCIYT
jgi:Ca2+-binding EF-hand superfamily protein